MHAQHHTHHALHRHLVRRPAPRRVVVFDRRRRQHRRVCRRVCRRVVVWPHRHHRRRLWRCPRGADPVGVRRARCRCLPAAAAAPAVRPAAGLAAAGRLAAAAAAAAAVRQQRRRACWQLRRLLVGWGLAALLCMQPPPPRHMHDACTMRRSACRRDPCALPSPNPTPSPPSTLHAVPPHTCPMHAC